MPIQKIDILEFHSMRLNTPVIDVRSEGEYLHAHIPGAFSVPIFNNSERKIIGTAYKQESREKAIRFGMEFFGQKLVALVDKVNALFKQQQTENREIIVHCWRGGMRSAAMSWLLDLNGYRVFLLVGGYKKYRHWALAQLEKTYSLHVLAGFTGSNKTGVLTALREQAENVLDLEQLAGHRGSTFGNLEELPQPSQEYFENTLAETLSQQRESKAIWVEGESQRIGKLNIPKIFYEQMLAAPCTVLQIPFAARLQHIMHGYGRYAPEKIAQAILRITKKLGGLESKTALTHLHAGEREACYAIILTYYDRLYHRSAFSSRTAQNHVHVLEAENTDALANAKKLLTHVNTH